jgi:low temperature requirement protein LtrA
MTLKRAPRPAPRPVEGAPVTTLELFFDLVFVFSVTQLTGLVLDSHTAGYLQAAAVLVVTFWMYDGYAWLSNNVAPYSVSTRIPMLVAMMGFFVMAIAVPNVFGHTAWQYAIAYLVVVALHAWSFTRSTLGGSAVAIRGIVPYNVAIALSLVLAAALGHERAWIGWTLSVVIITAMVLGTSGSGFTLRAEHFAERHQLIIIIALGETVVATGVGAGGHIDEGRSWQRCWSRSP